jgi:hypothetical protein
MKDRRMAGFIIHTHGRLQEWVAEEKGYYAAEGLTDYVLSWHGILSPGHVRAQTTPVVPDNLHGAYQTYEQGRRRLGQLCLPLDRQQGRLGRLGAAVG